MKTKSTGSNWWNGIGVILLIVAFNVGLAWVRARWHGPTNAEIQLQKWDAASEQMRKISADLDRQAHVHSMQMMDNTALASLLKPSPSPKLDYTQIPPLPSGSPSPGTTPAGR